MSGKNKKRVLPGLGIDSSGEPAVDPTANVLSLVEAAVSRLDDLREIESLRLGQLQSAEIKRIDDMANLRSDYQEKLTLAESKRIDAIRAVDVAAVATANDRAIAQAAILANQVAASAETLRALVASTAQSVAASLNSVSNQLIERISALEKTSYVGTGRQAVSDPMMTELVSEMQKLRASRDVGTGKSVGSTTMWGYVAAGIGILFGLVGLFIAVYNVFN